MRGPANTYLAPVHLEELGLGVAGGLDLLVLPVLDPVPQSHPARVEQAGDQHQDGRGRDVGRRRLPAAADAGREGDEHEEESHNEESNHCSHHIWRERKDNYNSGSPTLYQILTDSGHLLLVEGLGLIILIRDEVVDVPAVGLHRGDVDVLPDGDLVIGGVLLQLLSQVALSEQATGPCEVQWTLVEIISTDFARLEKNSV